MPSDLYLYTVQYPHMQDKPKLFKSLFKMGTSVAIFGTIENTAERLQKSVMSDPNANKMFLSSIPGIGKVTDKIYENLVVRTVYGLPKGVSLQEQFKNQGITFPRQYNKANIGMFGRNREWKMMERDFTQPVQQWYKNPSIKVEERKQGERLIRGFNAQQAINKIQLYEMSEVGYSLLYSVGKSLFFDPFVQRGMALEEAENRQESYMIKRDVLRDVSSQYDENQQKSMYRQMQLQEMSSQYIVTQQQQTIQNIKNPYVMYRY